MAQDLSESNSEILRELAKGEFNTDEQFEEMMKRKNEEIENLANKVESPLVKETGD